MSYAHSLAKFRNELGHGCDRRAYYSKKYNKVFKVCKHTWDTEQSDREVELFNIYGAEKLRRICPITDVFYLNGMPVIVMEKVMIMTEYIREHFDRHDWNRIENMNFIPFVQTLENEGIIKSDNLPELFTFLKNENVGDTYARNMGVFEGRLVMVDIGWPDS